MTQVRDALLVPGNTRGALHALELSLECNQPPEPAFERAVDLGAVGHITGLNARRKTLKDLDLFVELGRGRLVHG